ncbi:MAG: asparaginase [Chloroflexi bacterium]|nr:asparaginase [Chloroflexota bacterium]
MSARPTVVVLTTGGTIASRLDPATGAVRPLVSGPDLLAALPEAERVARVEVEEVCAVPSWNMTPALMVEVARRLARVLARPEVAGAVVTHGTDTVEETASLVDLLLASSKPVAFAVAMRNLSEVSPDGPRNLLGALTVAADPAAAGRGVLLVVNDEIHAARWMTKLNATHVDTFASPGRGPLGRLAWDGVRFFWPSSRPAPLPVDRIEERVALVKVVTGMDDALIRAALDSGARGLVIEGSGAGNVPDTVVPGIAVALDQGVPVVLVSRSPFGLLSPTYGTPGGGRSLRERGVILGQGLNGPKARIRLMVALAHTTDPARLRALFETTDAG